MPQEAKGNSDTSDNETHYYLADLMGNHVASVRDASESGGSAPSWQAFDAFGSALGKSGGVAGSLGWRGGEGSVSDRETGLVYMQSRHYDPSLGRFVQADALPLASLTTQGANRYIYCENDPVNKSDPSGRAYGKFFGPLLIGFGLISFIGGIATLAGNPLLGIVFLLGGISAMLEGAAMLAPSNSQLKCTLQYFAGTTEMLLGIALFLAGAPYALTTQAIATISSAILAYLKGAYTFFNNAHSGVGWDPWDLFGAVPRNNDAYYPGSNSLCLERFAYGQPVRELLDTSDSTLGLRCLRIPANWSRRRVQVS